MGIKKESVFIMAHCSNTGKPFYVRFDFAADNKWVMTYGIASQDKNEHQEGEAAKVDYKNFRIGPQFKCPYCKNGTIALCSCKAYACVGLDEKMMVCPTCGKKGWLSKLKKNISGSQGKSQ
ncbi:MAG: hypothetical protein FWG10_10630 [Eubacteriaceae bacterium]|nr:hypothetical protein [Eubacteriaceae bacterium]